MQKNLLTSLKLGSLVMLLLGMIGIPTALTLDQADLLVQHVASIVQMSVEAAGLIGLVVHSAIEHFHNRKPV
jgi:hypothetical protein